MNNTIYFDARCDDETRRKQLYAGQLFVYSPTANTLAFCDFARALIADAFQGLDPETAQHHLPVEDYARILGELKPAFIHHPESKRHLRNILDEFGCDLGETYFDVPKLRSSTSDNYLTTGIAYAWHPHRDTWYSAPLSQINWWIPLYELSPENGMAFHPPYWGKPVKNSSDGYNYYEWNKLHRGATVTQYLREDPRPLPKPTEALELDPQIRLIGQVGSIVLFSAAQMHSSVPNTSGKTRFSIDFRTVHRSDLAARAGAPWCDERCTGSTIRDYLRATDLATLPDEIIAIYDDETGHHGELVYDPNR